MNTAAFQFEVDALRADRGKEEGREWLVCKEERLDTLTAARTRTSKRGPDFPTLRHTVE